ncbi:WD-40 repeat-containing protein, partial [Reticulomyxa filosa]
HKYFKQCGLFNVHTNQINSVRFSPDGTKIVLSLKDSTIQLWSTNSNISDIKEIKGHSGCVNDAQFSHDGTMIVSCSKDKTIRLWDVSSCNEIKRFEDYSRNSIRSVQFSSDKKIIVASSIITARIWDIQSEKLIKVLRDSNCILDARILPNNHKIFVATADYRIITFDIISNKTTDIAWKNLFARTAQFSPDGLSIVSCLEGETIALWDVMSGTKVKQWGICFPPIKEKYFSSGQMILICCKDNTMRLWDMEFGVEIQQLEGHSEEIKVFDISHDENTIVSLSNDDTIRLWKVV